MQQYKRGFIPYLLAALAIGIVGGFSTVLGPAFVEDLGLSYDNTTWTALAQAMSTAACAPILGKLGDVFGRKRTLILGLVVFTLGNLLTALANSLVFMLLSRFIVGIGTAAIAPVILSYIVTEFPTQRVANGFSAYMLVSSASVIFGPTLGSIMIARWGWQSMMWLCVGICIAIVCACAVQKEKQTVLRKGLLHFDRAGAFWVLIFFSLLLCIPSFGQNFGWDSPAFLTVLICGAVSLAALLLTERRAKSPIIPLSFVRRKSFLLSVLALFLTQGLMQANMTCLIIFVNYTLPQQAAFSGYAISVLYLGMSLGAAFLGPLADKSEPKKVLCGSFAMTGLGCAVMFLFSTQTPLLLFMASLGILGLGLGGNGTIFMKIVLSGLSAQEAGAGSGTYGLFRDLSAPFGVAVLVPLFTNHIAALLHEGLLPTRAAVRSIHVLAAVEVFCVLAGLIVILFLPKIYHRGAEQ